MKYLLYLKGLFHPACLARVVSWFAFVVAIFMAHENGDKQRLAKRRHVQGMLDETDPLTIFLFVQRFHSSQLRNALFFQLAVIRITYSLSGNSTVASSLYFLAIPVVFPQFFV